MRRCRVCCSALAFRPWQNYPLALSTLTSPFVVPFIPKQRRPSIFPPLSISSLLVLPSFKRPLEESSLLQPKINHLTPAQLHNQAPSSAIPFALALDDIAPLPFTRVNLLPRLLRSGALRAPVGEKLCSFYLSQKTTCHGRDSSQARHRRRWCLREDLPSYVGHP